MKKFMSLLLCMVMFFTSMAPAVKATGVSSDKIVNTILADSFEQIDDAGNVMRFELISNTDGEYTLNFYLNNTLSTTYEMEKNSTVITATDKTGAINRCYTLEANEYAVATTTDTRGPDRWGHAGYIQYGYSSYYDCNPIGIVSYKDTDSYHGTYQVNTYENSSYSDWVAVVTSVLIAALVGVTGPATIAAGIVAGLIGYYSGEVINDVISIAFIEEYFCSSVTYTMRAEVIGSTITNARVVDYEGGVEYWVRYADAPKEYYNVGWTPMTWDCRDFAQEVWADSIPFWPACPEIIGYPKYL